MKRGWRPPPIACLPISSGVSRGPTSLATCHMDSVAQTWQVVVRLHSPCQCMRQRTRTLMASEVTQLGPIASLGQEPWQQRHKCIGNQESRWNCWQVQTVQLGFVRGRVWNTGIGTSTCGSGKVANSGGSHRPSSFMTPPCSWRTPGASFESSPSDLELWASPKDLKPGHSIWQPRSLTSLLCEALCEMSAEITV